MHYSKERQQHIEDTEFLMWSDGMYIMINDLECDYELALIENSLRDSVYFTSVAPLEGGENCMGVYERDADYWFRESSGLFAKLTRAQALYIATGETCI